MRFPILSALLVALSLATPALAHHPGEKVRLSDFADKIVVLNFIFASCVSCAQRMAAGASVGR